MLWMFRELNGGFCFKRTRNYIKIKTNVTRTGKYNKKLEIFEIKEIVIEIKSTVNSIDYRRKTGR